MHPSVTKVKKINQANYNPSSNWSKARYAWVKQLAIRFGILDPTKFSSHSECDTSRDTTNQCTSTNIIHINPVIRERNEIPKYYDPRELTPLDRDQIALWDETHLKVILGTSK